MLVIHSMKNTTFPHNLLSVRKVFWRKIWYVKRCNFRSEWLFYFIFLRFYLFIFREGKEGRKRGRQTSMCGCLSSTPYWGPGRQPRHVPWLGIEPATVWFTSWYSIYWAPPARARSEFLIQSDGNQCYTPVFKFQVYFTSSLFHSCVNNNFPSFAIQHLYPSVGLDLGVLMLIHFLVTWTSPLKSSRAQVANTRPAGWIWPSTLFYPAAAPSSSPLVKEELHLHSPKIPSGPLKATSRLMWPRWRWVWHPCPKGLALAGVAQWTEHRPVKGAFR